MNYELFMGEALAEARTALARGERPVAAVAVVDEAMVARAHDRVQESNDPTAHAVVVALRETARKLGKDRLAERHDLRHARAVLDVRRRAARRATSRRSSTPSRTPSTAPPARSSSSPSILRSAQRVKIVSGIRRDEAEELFAAGRPTARSGLSVGRHLAGAFGILSRGEVSEWLMVPLSKSGVRKHRGFESRPLRQRLIAGPADR